MADAMRAASMGCMACERGEAWVNVVLTVEGGTPVTVHKGQSNKWLLACVSSSPDTTSLTAPAVVHTSSIDLGATTGDATATPMDNTNQTSTRRARVWARRRVCMARILGRYRVRCIGQTLTWIKATAHACAHDEVKQKKEPI